MKAIEEHVSKYAFSNVSKLRRLSEPLKNLYGIDIFWMHRIDADGSFSLLTNNYSQTQTWIEQGFFRTNFQLASPKVFIPSRVLADDVVDPLFKEEKEKMRTLFNMNSDCMYFRKPSENTVLEFGFASSFSKNKLRQLTCTSPETLEEFIDYFLEETQSLRKDMHEQAISLLPYRGKIFETGSLCHQDIIDLNTSHKRLLKMMKGDEDLLNCLTPAESRCVDLYIIKGLTAQETALKLNRSRRTIEAHFEHVRNKLGISSKRALIALFKQK